MRINVYDKWIDYPEGKTRSFKTNKMPFMMLDTQSMHINKIIQRLARVCSDRSLEKPNLLVVIRGKDYENSLEGNSQQINKFVKDCLVDLGLMSHHWAINK